MYQYTCLNPIASDVGLEQFTEDYEKTEKMEDADAVAGKKCCHA